MITKEQRETYIRLLNKFIKESTGLEGVLAFWKYVKKEAKNFCYSDGFVEFYIIENHVEETLEELKKNREDWYLPVGDLEEVDKEFDNLVH